MYIIIVNAMNALEVKELADTVAIVEPSLLMALTVMEYLLSSLSPVRVCDLAEPAVMASARCAPGGAEHLLTV